MISQETLDGLKRIGLNLYERKLYSALIARGTATVGELSALAGVPRSRAYDVLESLSDKGFVVIQHTKPLKFVAISPKEALEKTREIMKSNLSLNLKRIEQFTQSEGLKELELLYKNGVSLIEPADLSGSFKGSYAYHLQLNTMLKGTTKSLDVITTEIGLVNLWKNHSSLLTKAKEAGVRIRVIAPKNKENADAFNQLGSIASVKELKHGETKLPVGRMMIIDGREVLLGLTNDKKTHNSQDVSFWTSSDHFAESFAQATFNLVWNHL